MIQFAKRIQVYSSEQKWLHHVPEKEARRLLRSAGARIYDQRGNRVCGIQLCRPIGNPWRPPSSPERTAYLGQSYTHRQKLLEGAARPVVFKFIHDDDRDLFLLSVTDCLVAGS